MAKETPSEANTVAILDLEKRERSLRRILKIMKDTNHQ
jgi:hypothetical protein